MSTKDDYDPFLNFNRITPENWLLPDRKQNPPCGVGQDDWTKLFLGARLNENVPRDVIRLLEIARGCMIYSWFFYPLGTLGIEQCTRIGESAVRERCRLLGEESEHFGTNLQTLAAAGVISPEYQVRWQAVRRLRNDRSHLKGFMLLDPGAAASTLHSMVELINSLFSTPAKDWTAEWKRVLGKYCADVLSDWEGSRGRFPTNACADKHWPIPFFGDPGKALIATVGVNPAGSEFHVHRDWASVNTSAEWTARLKEYFRHRVPAHNWFGPWRAGLELLHLSYEQGTATHLDVSYRPTIAMLRNRKTDHLEFRRMIERDVRWFFQLLPLCPKLRGLLVFGPVVRADGTTETMMQFLRSCAPQHGFAIGPDGALLHSPTGRKFFLHETDCAGEKCLTCRVVNGIRAHRAELRRSLS